MKHNYPMTKKRLIVRYLIEIGRKIRKIERLSAGELTGSQLLILPAIAAFNNPPNINDVAEQIGSSHQNARNLLNKIERAGFVELTTDEFDYRHTRIVLTKKGREKVDEYYEVMRKIVGNMYRGIEDHEIAATSKVLGILSSRIHELHPQRDLKDIL